MTLSPVFIIFSKYRSSTSSRNVSVAVLRILARCSDFCIRLLSELRPQPNSCAAFLITPLPLIKASSIAPSERSPVLMFSLAIP